MLVLLVLLLICSGEELPCSVSVGEMEPSTDVCVEPALDGACWLFDDRRAKLMFASVVKPQFGSTSSAS